MNGLLLVRSSSVQLLPNNEKSELFEGYVPGPEALKVIEQFIKKWKEKKRDLIYVLDREYRYVCCRNS